MFKKLAHKASPRAPKTSGGLFRTNSEPSIRAKSPLVPPHLGKDNGVIQGCFTDTSHWVAGDLSFAGIRFITNVLGMHAVDEIVVVGSDDGKEIWSLKGKFLNRETGELTIDFAPKGGPADVNGVYNSKNGQLTWSDGNFWSRIDRVPDTLIQEDTPESAEGKNV